MRPLEFPYEKDRAHNAALWLLHRHGMQLDLMKMLKLVFLADLKHLLTFERPIVGGTYKAMTFGPVAHELYNDMKADFSFVFDPPYTIKAASPVNEAFLSESDINALRSVDDTYGSMDGFALSAITHKFSLWANHRVNAPIPYEDFFLDIPSEHRQHLGIDMDGEDRALLLEILQDRQETWAMLR